MIRTNRSAIAVALLISLTMIGPASGTLAQSLPKISLLALSKTDHMLAVVDPVTLKVVARIPVGEDPHEVIASSDGKIAYVTNYGGGSLHELNVIDLVARKPLPSVDTRPLFGPHGLTFAAGKAWFSAEGSKAVGRYDPATGKLDWSMGTGQDRTHMIYVTPDGKKVYTTNVSSGTVSILTDSMMPPPGSPPPGDPHQGDPHQGDPHPGDPHQGDPHPGDPHPGDPHPGVPPPGFAPPGAKPREDWMQTVIPTARGSEGFDVSPDGKELWTAASENGVITIIDLDAKKLVTKLDAKVTGANRLKFTPDGKQVFISSLQSGELTIYDARSHTEIKRLKTGHGAAGILMDPDGSRAFVACSADNYVVIVDLKTLQITQHIDVGGVPDGLAWAVQP